MSRRLSRRLLALQGLVRPKAYYGGPVSDHFDGLRFHLPAQPRDKKLADLLRWQIRGRQEGVARKLSEPVRRQAPGDVRGPAHHPHRPCVVSRSGGGPQYPDRSRLRRPRKPVRLYRPEARQPARHRLRGPARDPHGAAHAQPLRSSGPRGARSPVAARPSPHRGAARQRYDRQGAASRHRGRDAGLGGGGGSGPRDLGASAAGLSLVGTRARTTGAWPCGARSR